MLAVSALAISLGLLLLAPDMDRYAGFSGLVCAWLTWLGINGVLNPNSQLPATNRCVYGILLLAIPAKILFETASNSTLIAYSTQAFVPMHLAHAIGALTALLVFAASRLAWTRSPSLTSEGPTGNFPALL